MLEAIVLRSKRTESNFLITKFQYHVRAHNRYLHIATRWPCFTPADKVYAGTLAIVWSNPLLRGSRGGACSCFSSLWW